MKLSRFYLSGSILFMSSLVAGCVQATKSAPKEVHLTEGVQKTVQKMVTFWKEKLGRTLLSDDNTLDSAYWRLVDYAETQNDPFSCGIASGVGILNAFRIPKMRVHPEDVALYERPLELGGNQIKFSKYTQNGFLNEATEATKQENVVKLKAKSIATEKYSPGFELEDLQTILTKRYKLDVDAYRTNGSHKDEDIDKFRKIIVGQLSKAKDDGSVDEDEGFIIANFLGSALGLETGGHFSPIGAYNKEKDSLMVMDVARHRNTWFWVSMTDFYNAMNTVDKESGKFRGLLVVKDNLKR